MTDGDREARLDRMVAETDDLIYQANDVAASLQATLESLGCKDTATLQKLLQSSECPSDLRKQANDDFDKLHEELLEEENRLPSSDSQSSGGKHPRSGMTKI